MSGRPRRAPTKVAAIAAFFFISIRNKHTLSLSWQ
jgi:hypothetical protein